MHQLSLQNNKRLRYLYSYFMILCCDSVILIVSGLGLISMSSTRCTSSIQCYKINTDFPLRQSTVYTCGKFNNTSCPSTIGPNWNSRCDNRAVVSMVISARNPSKPNPKHPACSKVWRSISLELRWRMKTVYMK
jgi:hypothetical protein